MFLLIRLVFRRQKNNYVRRELSPQILHENEAYHFWFRYPNVILGNDFFKNFGFLMWKH